MENLSRTTKKLRDRLTRPAFEILLIKCYLQAYRNHGGKLDYNIPEDKKILDEKIKIAINRAEIKEKGRFYKMIGIAINCLLWHDSPDISLRVFITVSSILRHILKSYAIEEAIVSKHALMDSENENQRGKRHGER